MSFNANRIATGQSQKFFFALESTAGTAAEPTTNNGGLLIKPLEVEQPVEPIEDQQIRYTVSPSDDIQAKREPATFKLSTYLKPSGVLGTRPEGGIDALLTAGFGSSSVVGGNDVRYSLLAIGSDLPTYTLYWRDINEFRRLTGCVVTSITWHLNTEAKGANAPLNVDFEGVGLQLKRCYVDQLAGNISATDNTITVTNAKKFEVGSLLCINDAGTLDTNGGAGYHVSGVNTSTNVLTISDSGGVDSPHTAGVTVTVEPFLPDVTEVGTPIHSGLGSATLGGQAVAHTGIDVTFKNGVMIPTDIAGSTEYPPAYYIRADRRQLTIDVNAYADLSTSGTTAWYYHSQFSPLAFLAQVNNRSGVDAVKFSAPRCFLTNPITSGDKARKRKFMLRPKWSAAFDDEFQLDIAAP